MEEPEPPDPRSAVNSDTTNRAANNAANPQRRQRQPRNQDSSKPRNPRNSRHQPASNDHPEQSQAKPRRRRPKQEKDTAQEEASGSASSSVIFITGAAEDVISLPSHMPAPSQPTGGGTRQRRQQFRSGLTSEQSGPSVPKPVQKGPRPPRNQPAKESDDLTSTLIRGLSKPPYNDCPICFNAIHPAQPTWSCSPSMPIASETAADSQYCWSTFHLKCIRSWAEKSYNEVKEAWRARGEPERGGEWRCPGCQGRRQTLIGGYWCFCNSTPNPQSRLGTPHSCGNPCSRRRMVSGCMHPCPLSCHPGPCPPCKVTLEVHCGCPRDQPLTVRCGEDTHNMSCGAICARPLVCGNSSHTCTRPCHLDECGACPAIETVSCWCKKSEKEGRCGEFNVVIDDPELVLKKGFPCGQKCDKPYSCGQHECPDLCHPCTDVPRPCPFSPEAVKTCPCGKTAISSSTKDIPEGQFPARLACTDPIPTCKSPCLKIHPECNHPCQMKCHLGSCPPCTEDVVRPCRCGATKRTLKCGSLYFDSGVGEAVGAQTKEILCERACTALRACGRHQCNRICCPLASFAANATKGKGKKRALEVTAGVGEGAGGLHECDLVCGKVLTCGTHRCEERDHRGMCPPCLRSSFEEMICPCGRTVLEPPVPCGTQIKCHYPCPLPPPLCGHAMTPHSCHSVDKPCPPCPSLTRRECACGKKVVPNVRCSLEKEKVGCGSVCGKLMKCGFHRCERLCHGGDCGTCAAPCGKPLKLCLPAHHPCTHPCHAPAACPEDAPCTASIVLSCPCGRIQQNVSCNRSAASPKGRSETQLNQQAPKCNAECGIAKRNARLADALGINIDKDKAPAGPVYSDEVVGFARLNSKFVAVVEKTFHDFVNSGRKTQVLPHTPVDRRQFVHDLAAVYRMDTQYIDQEPHRSVQLVRRIDTRVPNPLLSAHIASASLGKLADLRSPPSSSTSSWRSGPPIAVAPAAKPLASRGWTSVATRPPPAPVPVASPGPSTIPVTTRSPATRVSPLPSAALEPQPGVPDNWEDEL